MTTKHTPHFSVVSTCIRQSGALCLQGIVTDKTREHEQKAARTDPHFGRCASKARSKIECAHYGFATRWTAIY